MAVSGLGSRAQGFIGGFPKLGIPFWGRLKNVSMALVGGSGGYLGYCSV